MAWLPIGKVVRRIYGSLRQVRLTEPERIGRDHRTRQPVSGTMQLYGCVAGFTASPWRVRGECGRKTSRRRACKHGTKDGESAGNSQIVSPPAPAGHPTSRFS